MHNILQEIVEHKRKEVAIAKARVSEGELESLLKGTSHPTSFGFYTALSQSGMQVIAEVKRKSPAAGEISRLADAPDVASLYCRGGAACISVLTDEKYFGGTLSDLRSVRKAVATPLLRKDFIIDRYQLLEARLAGADAVLLIAEILDDNELRFLLDEAEALHLDVLLECYEEKNLHRSLVTNAKLIGVNNRNLRTFEVNLDHSIQLAKHVPTDRVLISESGIRTREDVIRLEQAGIKAILVGETLMRSTDPVNMISQLIGR